MCNRIYTELLPNRFRAVTKLVTSSARQTLQNKSDWIALSGRVTLYLSLSSLLRSDWLLPPARASNITRPKVSHVCFRCACFGQETCPLYNTDGDTERPLLQIIKILLQHTTYIAKGYVRRLVLSITNCVLWSRECCRHYLCEQSKILLW